MLLLMKLKKNSKLSQVLSFSIYAEAFQQFTQAVVFGNISFGSKVKYFFEKIGEANMFLQIPFGNVNSTYEKMITLNISLMFTTEAYALMMHIFVFFELIFMMQNPIGSASLRIKIYNLVSFICSLLIFIIMMIIKKEHVGYSYKSIVECDYQVVLVIFGMFLIMALFGILNIIYTIRRLGCKTFVKQTYYNKFLFGQIIMMFTYYLCICPLKIVAFIYALNLDFELASWFVESALIMYSLLGLVQFLSRILETNFYNILGRCLKKMFCFWRKDVKMSPGEKNDDVSIILIET